MSYSFESSILSKPIAYDKVFKLQYRVKKKKPLYRYADDTVLRKLKFYVYAEAVLDIAE